MHRLLNLDQPPKFMHQLFGEKIIWFEKMAKDSMPKNTISILNDTTRISPQISHHLHLWLLMAFIGQLIRLNYWPFPTQNAYYSLVSDLFLFYTVCTNVHDGIRWSTNKEQPFIIIYVANRKQTLCQHTISYLSQFEPQSETEWVLHFVTISSVSFLRYISYVVLLHLILYRSLKSVV